MLEQTSHLTVLAGDIDMETVPSAEAKLVSALTHENCVYLRVDCSGITFLDSQGLALMLRMQRIGEENGTRLVWMDPPRNMLRVIQSAGLSEHFRVELTHAKAS